MIEKAIYSSYAVTDDGQVISYIKGYRKVLSRHAISRNQRYYAVRIKINGKSQFRYVHRLVAEAFLYKASQDTQVNHIDGNTFNNNFSNLEWCTASHNIQHAYKLGLKPTRKCVKCGDEIIKQSNKRGDELCKKCYYPQLLQERKLKNKVEKQKRIKEEFYNTYPNNKMQNEIIELRKDGKTYKAIGDLYGLSRQRIHQIIKSIAICQEES